VGGRLAEKCFPFFLSLGSSRADSLMGLRAVHGVAPGADQGDQAPGKLAAGASRGNSSAIHRPLLA
jgi:hypothetical protein